MRKWLILSLASSLCAISSSLSAQAETGGLEITKSYMRFSGYKQNGDEISYKTNNIPYLINNSCYHWVIHFTPGVGTMEIDEEVQLPAPAPLWGSDPDNPSIISPDKSSAITRRTINLADGMATNGWCVAKGDPKGAYSYTLRYKSEILTRLDFTVGNASARTKK
jgi:hypothetical protein